MILQAIGIALAALVPLLVQLEAARILSRRLSASLDLPAGVSFAGAGILLCICYSPLLWGMVPATRFNRLQILDRILLHTIEPIIILQLILLGFALSIVGHRWVLHPLQRLLTSSRPGRRLRRLAGRITAGSLARARVLLGSKSHELIGESVVEEVSPTRKEMRIRTPARPLSERAMKRRKFIQTSAMTLGGLAMGGSLLSAADVETSERIETVNIRIPNLPPQLRGYRIVLVSDIHSSSFMTREKMERYVELINALDGDLIVVPGDFVNSKIKEVFPFAEAFSRLRAPDGVYGVTGNHDYYTGDIDRVVSEATEAGIQILRNRSVSIEVRGARLRLMGIDDGNIHEVRQYLSREKTDSRSIESMLEGADPAEPTILLCHKPYPFEEFAQIPGVDLMLSGHTHGGQIVLGDLDRLNISFASLASPYIAGLYKARANPEAQMYVTRGVGTVGIPVRVNCPPEITHITLV